MRTVATLLLALSLSAFAQSGTDPCHARPTASAAAKSFLSFDLFNKELRAALNTQDALSLAFLVKFPLRVNDASGTILLNDAPALKTYFDKVFTPAVRKEILENDASTEPCGPEGVGYSRGVIWVEASERGYAIAAVNRDSVPPYPRKQRTGVEFVCRTQTHRIAVETLPDGMLRYRSWKLPRPVTGTPDLEITKGEQTFEGTNVCAVPVFTFRSGNVTYKLGAGLGCDSSPPKNATGDLEIMIADKTPTTAWCF